MPCRVYDDEEIDDQERERADKLTRMLCSLCSAVDKHNEKLAADRIVVVEMPHNVASWWQKHKAEDERRRAEAKAEAERVKKEKKLRKNALAKLTKEERRVLGL